MFRSMDYRYYHYFHAKAYCVHHHVYRYHWPQDTDSMLSQDVDRRPGPRDPGRPRRCRLDWYRTASISDGKAELSAGHMGWA